MRLSFWFGAALVVLLPFAGAAINPVPVIALKLDTAMQTVNVTENTSATAVYSGECAIDKLPYVRATVTLNASTDQGWAAQVSPETMVFTNTDPQAFTVTVLVPAATRNITAYLNVKGTVVANGLQSSAETQAVLTVIGPPPAPPAANQTGNGTGSGARPADRTTGLPGLTSSQVSPGFLGLGNDLWIVAGAAAVFTVMAAGVAVRARRRKRAALAADASDDG